MHTRSLPSDGASLSFRGRRRLKTTGWIALGVAALIVVTGIVSRIRTNEATEAYSAAQSIPDVSVVEPVPTRMGRILTLPGELSAFYSAPLYARVPGYVHAWYEDIGAHVQKGEVLATIDTPDLDQQIAQAKADVVNEIAAQQLAKTTADRWTSLLKVDAVSEQEADEKTADLAVKSAQVAAVRANVERLEALKDYARITAPFDGVITARNVDVGDLVNVGAEAAPDTSLFRVADIHEIRVYVSVPQNYSAAIHSGVTATLKLPEYPDKVFTASLDTTSNAISEASGTLLVELLADNASAELKPGEYAQVTLQTQGAGVLRIPASALTFRQAGLRVATVLPNDHVLMKPVTIARDLGVEVEIASGLAPTDRVIDNPPDSIKTGDVVHVVNAKARSA
jgi:membrane fusion protein, multidrug efflux system